MDAINKYLKSILIVLLIAAIIIIFPKLAGIKVSDILEYAPESSVPAALVLLGIYCLKSVTFIMPLKILYISAGVIFSTGWAIVVTYVCLFCEISITYYMGRRIGREKVEAMIDKNEKAREFLTRNENNKWMVCLLARLLPVPFDFASMFFGASGMPYWMYMIFSFIGLTPGMLPYVLMGDAITNPLSMGFLLPCMISGIIMICTLMVYRRWRKREDKR